MENAEAMPESELEFYTDTAHADTVDPDEKNAEAMLKFGMEFFTDTARADTVSPDKKNAKAMPKFGLVSRHVALNLFCGQKL